MGKSRNLVKNFEGFLTQETNFDLVLILFARESFQILT